MRYIVSVAAAFLVLIILGSTTGFGDWPRPWGPLSRGAVGGAVAIAILIVWEQMSPRPDSLRDEDKAAEDREAEDRADEDTAAEAVAGPADPAAEAVAGSEGDAGSEARDARPVDDADDEGEVR
ncbi:hypothetical protein [Brevibacterium senegalense]|uniref:hypothetical protein n=1 Tax=Brevibacterium senegalense TaxID=1033736 RepID=UPI000318022C|nr:hypothetical protein [Brevibacterium senegalense]